MRVRKLITHANCIDGLASAMIIREALGRDLPVEFVQYNTREHAELRLEPGLLFCDMTPPESRTEEFVEVGALCLDHHKHAEGIVRKFGEHGVFADERLEPGVSGAVLAWREVYVPVAGGETFMPAAAELAELVGIRDTWQKDHPRWQEALGLHAVLQFYPSDYWLHSGISNPIGWALSQRFLAKILLAEQARRVTEAQAKVILETDDRGRTWALSAAPYELVSDLAELLRQSGVAVLVNVFFKTDGARVQQVYSLRSDGSVDVGALAKANGGGGHTRASGFSVSDGIRSATGWLHELQRCACP